MTYVLSLIRYYIIQGGSQSYYNGRPWQHHTFLEMIWRKGIEALSDLYLLRVQKFKFNKAKALYGMLIITSRDERVKLILV